MFVVGGVLLVLGVAVVLRSQPNVDSRPPRRLPSVIAIPDAAPPARPVEPTRPAEPAPEPPECHEAPPPGCHHCRPGIGAPDPRCRMQFRTLALECECDELPEQDAGGAQASDDHTTRPPPDRTERPPPQPPPAPLPSAEEIERSLQEQSNPAESLRELGSNSDVTLQRAIVNSLAHLQENFASLARVAATCRGSACEPYQRVARQAIANFRDYRSKQSARCNYGASVAYTGSTCSPRSVSEIFQSLEAVRQLSGLSNVPEPFTCNCDTLRIR